MKRLSAKVSLLLLVSIMALITGCNRNSGTEEVTPEEGQKSTLTFTLRMPQGEPFTYRSAIHDQYEWKVKSLTMYQFNADGSDLLSIETIDMDRLVPVGDAEYSYTKKFENTSMGVFQFVFVANDVIAGATLHGTTLEQFEKLLMTKKLNTGGSSKDLVSVDGTTDYNIPMTGFAKQGLSRRVAVTGTSKPVSVVLTRVVARIDISNHIPNLNITKMSVKNTYDRATTFPSQDASKNYTYQAPNGAEKVTMGKGFADLPTPFKGTTGSEGTKLAKAFYLYEGPQPQDATKLDEMTTIVVEGELENGKHVVFDIPLVVNSSNPQATLSVKRNYLYRVVLGDNKPLEPGRKVKFAIEVEPWNAVTLNHDMQIIKVLSWDAEYESHHYEELTRTLRTSNRDNYSFSFETRFANHNEFTVKMVSSESGVTYKVEKRTEADGKVKWYAILKDSSNQVPEQYKKKEKVVFEITSDASSETKCLLTICIDSNYKNPNWNK